jgi:RimJ/RimL family protein N-acetyltransferase
MFRPPPRATHRSPTASGAPADGPGELIVVDGARLTVRPIRADDKEGLARLFGRLSPQSRRRRFLIAKPALSRRELAYFTEVDHRRHEALVAVAADREIVGVARYACERGQASVADVAFVVADEWHDRGVGSSLARRLVDRARGNGIVRLQATTLAENTPARRLLHRLGFTVSGVEGAALDLRLELTAAATTARHAA